jgi:hypothetical protein
MTIYVVISTFQLEARPDKPVRPDRHGPPRPASVVENAQVTLKPNTVHAFAHTVDRLRRQRSEQ